MNQLKVVSVQQSKELRAVPQELDMLKQGALEEALQKLMCIHNKMIATHKRNRLF